MAIIKDIEIWHVKLNPLRPAKNMDPKKPSRWELQIRTSSKDVRKALAEMNIVMKPMREDKADDESKVLYYYKSLHKPTINAKGEKTQPVQVVNGKGGDVDPNTIGNGSIANLMVFQYEYTFEGKSGISTMLQRVQLRKHILYVPHAGEEFEDCETEVVEAAPRASKPAGTTGEANANDDLDDSKY